MTIRYPAAKARVNFGEILDSVANQGNEIVIERLGEPIARVSPYRRSRQDITWLREKIARYVKHTDSAQAVRRDRNTR
ncbi:type II toxin-antitoxin system prevent-host-death family antitoxin [Candidatus Berkelbacteria bacterium]|nr:type II toxin-antitoxin system prevent-host-death family antitoxin [Candidatus Berkelbacteria bacterium]